MTQGRGYKPPLQQVHPPSNTSGSAPGPPANVPPQHSQRPVPAHTPAPQGSIAHPNPAAPVQRGGAVPINGEQRQAPPHDKTTVRPGPGQLGQAGTRNPGLRPVPSTEPQRTAPVPGQMAPPQSTAPARQQQPQQSPSQGQRPATGGPQNRSGAPTDKGTGQRAPPTPAQTTPSRQKSPGSGNNASPFLSAKLPAPANTTKLPIQEGKKPGANDALVNTKKGFGDYAKMFSNIYTKYVPPQLKEIGAGIVHGVVDSAVGEATKRINDGVQKGLDRLGDLGVPKSVVDPLRQVALPVPGNAGAGSGAGGEGNDQEASRTEPEIHTAPPPESGVPPGDVQPGVAQPGETIAVQNPAVGQEPGLGTQESGVDESEGVGGNASAEQPGGELHTQAIGQEIAPGYAVPSVEHESDGNELYASRDGDQVRGENLNEYVHV